MLRMINGGGRRGTCGERQPAIGLVASVNR
jgi:hypothetical protein